MKNTERQGTESWQNAFFHIIKKNTKIFTRKVLKDKENLDKIHLLF